MALKNGQIQTMDVIMVLWLHGKDFSLLEPYRCSTIVNTDAGKRDLPAPLRNRFTEIWVAEPTERSDLLMLAAAYLAGTAPQPPLDAVVDFYVAAKSEAVRNYDGHWSQLLTTLLPHDALSCEEFVNFPTT